MTNNMFSALEKEYKKSNTLRRTSILKKFGFETEEEYLGYLTYELKKKELKESLKNITKNR